ncbi:putative E3 ubiquitin-protein ligase HECTD1 [Paratrimastix pyriformis]|uniref:E3 ubiquitin-protein ligase HECTD1 n=1 Tax=Paratrimastix pyriformis TaxID=342808 RepID=A0ABQ8UJN2_9EUKA|nr:putative E3 ubiquitin-protein ligase HECTD1 [Paratrimastix pyriformis]
MPQRLLDGLQCHCPNRGLGCPVVLAVQAVELHLRSGCEWREEECDQCHQQVRRAEMARHKDTTCARKPMACGYADVGCPTRCAQEDLAAHERDGVVAHMGLLRQRLADTSADLTQCKADLSQCKADLTQCKADLAQTRAQLSGSQAEEALCQEELAQTKMRLGQFKEKLGKQLTVVEAELFQTKTDLSQAKAQLAESIAAQRCTAAALSQTQHDLVALRSMFDQLFIRPAAPIGLVADWEAMGEITLHWRPGLEVAAPLGDPADAFCALTLAAPPGPPIRYRVETTGDDVVSSPVVVYTGPECRCRYRFPPGAVPGRAGARFVVVAMRGLAESGPSVPAICTRPVVFRHDHDMDEQGLFYYIGTQGRTQPWQNPAEAGWVTATRSSEQFGNAADLTGRQSCRTFTGSQPTPSWWQVDLGAGRLFTPTRYTLRHTNHPPNVEFRLQSWRLEGSMGVGDSWLTLDEHTNEPNAIPARPDAMATFAVAPERAFPTRRFWVLMTGPSPNGHHCLMLSGLEMYGSLFKK